MFSRFLHNHADEQTNGQNSSEALLLHFPVGPWTDFLGSSRSTGSCSATASLMFNRPVDHSHSEESYWNEASVCMLPVIHLLAAHQILLVLKVKEVSMPRDLDECESEPSHLRSFVIIGSYLRASTHNQVKKWILWCDALLCVWMDEAHSVSWSVCYFRCASVGMATAAAAPAVPSSCLQAARAEPRLASAEPAEAPETGGRGGGVGGAGRWDMCVLLYKWKWGFLGLGWGVLVLRLSGVVTEAPWRLARQPSGQVTHTWL